MAHDAACHASAEIGADLLVIRPVQKEQLTAYVIDRCNVRST